MIIVRYADDIVVGFEHEADARRFSTEMRERLEEFALTLHPEKTRLIEFGRLAAAKPRSGAGSANRRPSLSWASPSSAAKLAGATSSSSGRSRATACGRSCKDQGGTAAANASADPRAGEVAEAGRHRLLRLPRGADQPALTAFRYHVIDLWRRTLRRRSQKDRTTWERTDAAGRRLPSRPRILHPWPNQRFAVKHPRWEPSA